MRNRFNISGSPSTVAFKILSDMLDWQKNFVNDLIIMTFTCSGYNLQTRCKMNTRFGISSSTCFIAFKLCEICRG